jgi:uncharacterized iron-regulated membrane protein
LRIERGASACRPHFDLHKTVGLYGALVLLAIAFSGIAMIFPDYLRPLIAAFSPVTRLPPPVASRPAGDAAPLSVDRAVVVAHRLFPAAEVKFVALPDGPTGVYRVTLRQDDDVRRSGGTTSVWIDQYRGDVLYAVDARRRSAGDAFFAWQFPLHNGEAFGLPGRLVVCLAGMAPLTLYVTGLLLWRRKRRARQFRQRKLARWRDQPERVAPPSHDSGAEMPPMPSAGPGRCGR